jgi:hypothetical protein
LDLGLNLLVTQVDGRNSDSLQLMKERNPVQPCKPGSLTGGQMSMAEERGTKEGKGAPHARAMVESALWDATTFSRF